MRHPAARLTQACFWRTFHGKTQSRRHSTRTGLSGKPFGLWEASCVRSEPASFGNCQFGVKKILFRLFSLSPRFLSCVCRTNLLGWSPGHDFTLKALWLGRKRNDGHFLPLPQPRGKPGSPSLSLPGPTERPSLHWQCSRPSWRDNAGSSPGQETWNSCSSSAWRATRSPGPVLGLVSWIQPGSQTKASHHRWKACISG